MRDQLAEWNILEERKTRLTVEAGMLKKHLLPGQLRKRQWTPGKNSDVLS